MFSRLAFAAFGLAAAVLPGACAPSPAGMAGPPPATSLSGPANPGPAAVPMAGMDHANMQNMDMSTMMAHCAQMRRQPGAGQTADGRQMLDRCDEMDLSMGLTPPTRR